MKRPIEGAGLQVAVRPGVPSDPGHYPATNEGGYRDRNRRNRHDRNSRDQHGRGVRPRREGFHGALSSSDRSSSRSRTPLGTLQRALAIAAAAIVLTTGASIGDTASASPRALESPTPMATQTPTPSQSDDLDHSPQNEEQRVNRDDLALIGVTFVIGLAFILVAGALGVLAVARQRRRIDRASKAEEDKASGAP